MIIKDYRKYSDIDIYFPEYNYLFEKAHYKSFKEGHIKCPYERRYYKKGYIGVGKFSTRENNRFTKSFLCWNRMLQRCYDNKTHNKHPTYSSCEVSEEWLNFQNFAQWYRDNYYEIEGERVALDKDILVKGNKIYSKESCIFVPQRINSLFVNTSASRGKYPIGISIVSNKYFQVLCNDVEGNCKYIGRYSSIEEAFNNYKNFKEDVIKEVADKYKYKIPNKLYNAMYNYNIEITD